MGDVKKDQKPFSYEKAKAFSCNSHSSLLRLFSKLVLTFAIIFSIQFVFYPLSFISSSQPQPRPLIKLAVSPVGSGPRSGSGQKPKPEQTEIKHVVFGIAASAKLWKHRREYVKLWWKPNGEMKGFVWLDKHIDQNDTGLPPTKVSSDTARFKYKFPKGNRSAIRLTRIVSETVRLLNGTESEKNVRWIVMGDDDTVFFADNLVRVLRKYDHNQLYYIGSSSESHIQNLKFSYGMAYGGGGFAISYPLAKALEKMQDRCIQRYPELYGSDDRIHACVAELGVPLTREVGFHQVSPLFFFGKRNYLLFFSSKKIHIEKGK